MTKFFIMALLSAWGNFFTARGNMEPAVARTSLSISHVGCFYDTNPEYILARRDKLVGDSFELMPYYSHRIPSQITPTLCAQHCVSKGFIYAALKENLCSCGDSEEGLIKATSHAIEYQCRVRCQGDPRTECGGKNVISLYKSIPTVRMQFPTRCQNGYWRLVLNESDNGIKYRPDVTKINSDRMLWSATTTLSPHDASNGRISMDLCTSKCETISTCWGVVIQVKPNVFRACALLDKPTIEESKRIIKKSTVPSEPQDINYGFQVWSCETMQSDQGGTQSQKRGILSNIIGKTTSKSASACVCQQTLLVLLTVACSLLLLCLT